MKTNSTVLFPLFLAPVCLFFTVAVGHAQIYIDEGTSNVSTSVGEAVVLENQSTLNILSGGNITAGSATGTGSSSVGVTVDQNGSVSMYSGSAAIGGTATGQGGTSSGLILNHDGIANIYGGTITGGTVNGVGPVSAGVQLFDGSLLNLYSGTVTGGSLEDYGVSSSIRVYDSTANIYGGILTVPNGSSEGIEVFEDGTVNIYGMNFNYAPGPISDTTGTLTGTLQDGSSLDITFVQGSAGEIVLDIVPEPSAWVLLAGGLLALFFIKRPRASLPGPKRNFHLRHRA